MTTVETDIEQKRADQQAVIDLMIRIYCKGLKHQSQNDFELCSDCHELALYARNRNDACPLMERAYLLSVLSNPLLSP